MENKTKIRSIFEIDGSLELSVCYNSLVEDIVKENVLKKINDNNKKNNDSLDKITTALDSILNDTIGQYFYQKGKLNIEEILLIFLEKCKTGCNDSLKAYYTYFQNNLGNYTKAFENNSLYDFINSLDLSLEDKSILYLAISNNLYLSKLKLNQYINPNFAKIMMNTFEKAYFKRLLNITSENNDCIKIYHEEMEKYLEQKMIKENLFPKITCDPGFNDALEKMDDDEFKILLYVIIGQASNKEEVANFDIATYVCKKMHIGKLKYYSKIAKLYNSIEMPSEGIEKK